MKSILYCGDTELTGAASYLAGLMTSFGWSFDYLPSHLPMTTELLDKPRSLLILSDFPAARFSPDCQRQALRLIERGCGLLMIGGWESFHGNGGDWNGSELASALPVEMMDVDDRVHFPQSAWLSPTVDHPVTTNIPWSMRPPAIGGLNQVVAKPGSNTLLNAHSFEISHDELPDRASVDSPVWSFRSHQMYPALVVGNYGSGRTAAFMSDVAPHWVGGFVDWGTTRVLAQAKNATSIDVGSDYARFWNQLLHWTAEPVLT